MHRLSHCIAVVALSSPAFGAGLLAPTDQSLPPLRITDHLVEAEIHDGIGRTTITQTFRNDTDRRLEATYVFPLPEAADLTDFRMTFNGKMTEGRVLPADEARSVYESIVRQSRDPGLIEFIGRRLLQMRVFPVEPGSDTTVQLRYQQVCQPVSGMHGYHYPLRTRTTSGEAHGTVRFNLSLKTTAGLRNIWSPTHAVEIVRDGDRHATVAYEANGGSLEDDFLLLYGTDDSELGLSVITHQPDPETNGHFVLMLTPGQLWSETKTQPQDVVFVLDTSGSMAGEKLVQAKGALGFCVDQLGEADRFSVVRFSTGFDALYEAPLAATRERRAEARAWIDDFAAAGGTNITDTLEHVVAMRAPADDGQFARPFVVIFLTDGQGNRTPEVVMERLASAGASQPGLRIFPFGVGHDVNTILLDRIADAHHGRPTYVQPGENLELVLSDFFSVVSRPVLTGLRISLPDIGACEQFPVTLGDLYHGQQLTIAACLRNQRRGPVKLTATRDGEIVEYVWPDVSFSSDAGAAYVPTVWAGRKIAYLVDQIRRHGETTEMVAEVVALSREHGIQTPYTSWLVDPERHRAVASGPVRRGVAGGRTGGAGAGGGIARRAEQERVLADHVGRDRLAAEIDGDDHAYFARMRESERAVGQSAGEGATTLARANAALKSMDSRDQGRLEGRRLLARQISGRWYNRIGATLVDGEFDSDDTLTKVVFGTPAYFRIVRNRPDLREALAAHVRVLVLMSDGQAVLVVDEDGIETISDSLWEQLNGGGD